MRLDERSEFGTQCRKLVGRSIIFNRIERSYVLQCKRLSQRIRSPSSVVKCPLYSGTYGFNTSFMSTWKHSCSLGHSFFSIVPGSGPALKLPAETKQTVLSHNKIRINELYRSSFVSRTDEHGRSVRAQMSVRSIIVRRKQTDACSSNVFRNRRKKPYETRNIQQHLSGNEYAFNNEQILIYK